MSLDRRIRRVESDVGKPSDVVVPVVWRGVDDERAKARIAEVEAKGWTVHLIRVEVRDRHSIAE